MRHMGGGRLPSYHPTERHKWFAKQEEEFDQGDRNEIFEARRIVTAANIWNLN